MTKSWKEQRARVSILAARARIRKRKERAQRQYLKSLATARFAQVETLFWVGVTGSLWISRRTKKSKEKRGNFIVEIFATFLIVQRWRQLQKRVASALRSPEANYRYGLEHGELPPLHPGGTRTSSD